MVYNIPSDVLFHYCLCTLITISKALQSCRVGLSLQSGRPSIDPNLALPFCLCKVTV